MPSNINHQVRLAARPVGLPKKSDWQFTEAEVPALKEGELLVRNHYVSVDPAMRGWMNDADTYVPRLRLGDVMRAFTVGEVIESKNPAFKSGEFVAGVGGMQEYSTFDGKILTKVDLSLAPPEAYLNSLGIAGLTAYCGLIKVGEPKTGQTVVISGAAGSVGAHVGQIANILGCRTVGVAGGAKKCAFLTDVLGFDEAIDYKGQDLGSALDRACPKGIDIFFDNVGGSVLNAAMARINFRARIIICGAISVYNNREAIEGPSNYLNLLIRSARLEGYIYFDWRDEWPEMIMELAAWRQTGRISCPEDIAEGGLEVFPDTLLRLFKGDNLGKLMIKLD